MRITRNLGINRSPALRIGRTRPALTLALSSLALSGFCACTGAKPQSASVSSGRVYELVGRTIDWEATSAQRFGFERPAPAKASAAPAAASGATASGFVWHAPEGWQRGPEKSMREVTYLAGAQGEVECYVTVLGGEGGGVAANLNRWRGQLGQAPLGEAELAALPRFPMLGVQAVAIEIERAAGQTEGAERMLGAVCLLPDRSLFVKLLGPRASVEAQREAFQQFCRSVEAAR